MPAHYWLYLHHRVNATDNRAAKHVCITVDGCFLSIQSHKIETRESSPALIARSEFSSSTAMANASRRPIADYAVPTTDILKVSFVLWYSLRFVCGILPVQIVSTECPSGQGRICGIWAQSTVTPTVRCVLVLCSDMQRHSRLLEVCSIV